METIQVVLDSALLRAADRAVRKLKTNRSALFREALRAHLAALDRRERERRDREGFQRYPDSLDEPSAWERVADWPEE
ncbi:MAG TPA: ribbon-helix-helix domain-containing protein [Thermoanaerobaculia bacterium]|jgi:metal-responsive CopG/Arc/MetJ family transcriptional regulator